MDLEKITRDIFRIPVLESHDVKARIDDKTYPVVNLGNRGLGILLTEAKNFAVNNGQHQITLQLLDKTFELTGRVVHVSPMNQTTSSAASNSSTWTKKANRHFATTSEKIAPVCLPTSSNLWA